MLAERQVLAVNSLWKRARKRMASKILNSSMAQLEHGSVEEVVGTAATTAKDAHSSAESN